MIILGITGGTAAARPQRWMPSRPLAALRWTATRCTTSLLQTSRPLQQALQERFPAAYPDGIFDRKKLCSIVFTDPVALEDLNQITGRTYSSCSPAVAGPANQEANRPLVAIEAIRLLESDIAKLCKRTIAVLAPTEDRVRRLMAREGFPRRMHGCELLPSRPMRNLPPNVILF